jgi:hypothetical protein
MNTPAGVDVREPTNSGEVVRVGFDGCEVLFRRVHPPNEAGLAGYELSVRATDAQQVLDHLAAWTCGHSDGVLVITTLDWTSQRVPDAYGDVPGDCRPVFIATMQFLGPDCKIPKDIGAVVDRPIWIT